jgi:hypothetical protein
MMSKISERPESVTSVLKPAVKNIGGFNVKRLLPSAAVRNVGPFVFWDEMGPVEFPPGEAIEVKPHPHVGLSTVTYLFKGAMFHRDSLGTQQEIRPGDVNLMRAGRGIVHSERGVPTLKKKGHFFHGIQSWLALPQAFEKTEPRFEHTPSTKLPQFEEKNLSGTLIMGELEGLKSPVQAIGFPFYCELQLGNKTFFELGAEVVEKAVYVISGELRVNGYFLEQGQCAVMKKTSRVFLEGLNRCHLMIFGGEPLKKKKHLWWNFVSSDRDTIEKAKEDWQRSINTEFNASVFTMPPEESEYIPLPDQCEGPPKQDQDCPTT